MDAGRLPLEAVRRIAEDVFAHRSTPNRSSRNAGGSEHGLSNRRKPAAGPELTALFARYVDDGDEAALEEAYQRSKRFALGAALKHLDLDDAEDAAAEGWRCMVEDAKEIRERGIPFFSALWLRVTRRAIDIWRSREDEVSEPEKYRTPEVDSDRDEERTDDFEKLFRILIGEPVEAPRKRTRRRKQEPTQEALFDGPSPEDRAEG